MEINEARARQLQPAGINDCLPAERRSGNGLYSPATDADIADGIEAGSRIIVRPIGENDMEHWTGLRNRDPERQSRG